MTDKKGNAIAPKLKIALSLVSTSIATSLNFSDLAPQNNDYLAIGGLPAAVVDPKTSVQQAKAVGSVGYEGLKTIVQGLDRCSNMCPPLKTAVGVFLTIIGIVEVCVLVYNNDNLFIDYSCGQTVLENKKELEDLKAKLEAILSIVKHYQKQGIESALRDRIERFCESVTFSSFFCHVYIHQYLAALSSDSWSRSTACRSIHCRLV